MSASDLKTAISRAIGADKILNLTAALIGAPAAGTLLGRLFAGGSARIAGAAVALSKDKTAVLVTGTADFQAFRGCAVNATVTVAAGDSVSLVLAIALADGWTLKQLFPGLSDATLEGLNITGASVIAASEKTAYAAFDVELAAGVNLVGTLNAPKSLPSVTRLLANPTLPVYGAIDDLALPLFALQTKPFTAKLLSTTISDCFLAFSVIDVAAQDAAATGSKTAPAQAAVQPIGLAETSIQGTLSLGGGADAVIKAAFEAGSDVLDLAATFQQAHMSDFAKLVPFMGGGVDPWSSLPAEIKSAADKINRAFVLKQLNLSYDIAASRFGRTQIVVDVDLASFEPLAALPVLKIGQMQIAWTILNSGAGTSCTFAAKAPVSIENRYQVWVGFQTQPDNSYTGSVAQDPSSKLNVGDLVSAFLPGMDYLPKLVVADFDVALAPRQKQYSLTATLDGSWDVLAELGISLNEIDLTAFYDGALQPALSGTVQATFQLALVADGETYDVDFQLRAERPSGGQGWRFDASTGHAQLIPIGDLVDGLIKKFGVSGTVPKAIDGITIENLSFSYDSQSKELIFAGTSQFAIEGQPFQIVLSIDVNRTNKTLTFSGIIGVAEYQLDLTFTRSSGAASGAAETTLVATWTGAGNVMSLPSVLGALGVSAPSGLGSVGLKAASLTYDSSAGALNVSGEVEGKGKLPIGNLSYDVDLHVVVNSATDASTGKRVVSAHFETDLAIGPSTFAVSFNVGTVTNVIGLWKGGAGQPLTLTDIADKVGIPAPSNLPSGLNLGLKAASFTYDASGHAFTLSAESVQFGDAFFVTARGTDGATGFVFGLDTAHAGHLSSLPGIGPELKAADVLTFQKVSFLISSGTFKDFVIPGLPALPATPTAGGPSAAAATAGRPVAPMARGASLQLSPGLSLAALMTFSGGSADQRMANLGSIVDQPSLVLQVSISQSLLRIFCALAGTVYIPAGGRNKLALSNPSVEIDITVAPPVMTVQMSGGTAFTALGMPVSATARLMISEIEAQVACTIGADGGQIHVPALGALPVASLGVEIGAYFAPPGVDLGVQGQIMIGQQARAFALVLEMVEEAPNPLYLAYYINQANLFDVLTMFMPQLSAAAAGAAALSPAIYNKAMQTLSLVHANDLSFHWCDNVVVLPDGTVAQPGLGFSAGITIFSWSGFAQMELSAANGVSGTCEMSAIDLRGVLRVDGDGAGIKRNAPPSSGPFQGSPNLQILPSGSSAGEPGWMVPPGGAVFQVNAAGPNFLHANWKVSLFDAVRQSVDVTVTTTGFTFVINFQAGSVARFALSCILDGKSLSFSASAALALQVTGSIGPIHVAGISVGSISLPNISVSAALGVSLNTSMFSLSLQGSFQFQSMSLSIPSVSFSAAPKSVAELPALMLRAIQQEADVIFAALMGNVEKWADLVGRGVVTGVTDMANTLQNAYHVSAQDAARLMTIGKQSTETIASGLKTVYHQTDAQVATLLHGAGYTTQQIAQTFKNIGISADETIGILQNTLHVSADEALGAVRGVFTKTHADVVVTPHIDTTQPPHGDANTPHGDAVTVPHGDTRTGHGDTTQPPHGDTHSPHVDFSAGHVDHGLGPFGHADFGTHTDTGSIHVDTPSVHADIGSVHADTPNVHADVPKFHTDTPSVHVDKSPVHTDTNI